VPDPLRSLGLQLRTLRRTLRRRPSLRALAEPLDERMVFVLGSPRSGTTFLASAIGSCPGLADLGEVPAFKAAIPELAARDPRDAASRVRSILTLARRLSLVGSRRAVEQTPEAAFVAAAIRIAFPQATLVHIVRDGRDVVCSLLERGWLSTGRAGADDAGQTYGEHARFWVEPGRRAEFAQATDARRAAWAWRRYVSAARASDAVEVRYERLATAPAEVATELAAALAVDPEPLAGALAAARDSSIGRYRRELTPEQLAEVEVEAGGLLRALGYAR
jgi:hypothetical protein